MASRLGPEQLPLFFCFSNKQEIFFAGLAPEAGTSVGLFHDQPVVAA